jgi:hypothetical protein
MSKNLKYNENTSYNREYKVSPKRRICQERCAKERAKIRRNQYETMV